MVCDIIDTRLKSGGAREDSGHPTKHSHTLRKVLRRHSKELCTNAKQVGVKELALKDYATPSFPTASAGKCSEPGKQRSWIRGDKLVQDGKRSSMEGYVQWKHMASRSSCRTIFERGTILQLPETVCSGRGGRWTGGRLPTPHTPHNNTTPQERERQPPTH